MSHNQWLILMFFVYIAVIVTFALLYDFLCRSNRRNFSFAADILGDQKIEFHARASEELESLHTQDDIYQELYDRLARKEVSYTNQPKGGYSITYGEVTLSPDTRVELKSSFILGQGSIRTHFFITTYSRDGKKLFDLQESRDGQVSDDFFISMCSSHLESIKNRTRQLESRLKSFDSATPDVWNFVDFLYFSTITQTTVGYGDILPNSSTVRVFVAAQILSGYLILAILLNMAFGTAG